MTTKKRTKSPGRARKAKDVAQRTDFAQPGVAGTGEPVKKRLYRQGTPIVLKEFKVGQVVATPIAVCESQKAKIVGVEWGPENSHLKDVDRSGWVYWLVEVVQPDLTEFAKKLSAASLVLLFPVVSDQGCMPKGGSPWAAGESELLKWAKG